MAQGQRLTIAPALTLSFDNVNDSRCRKDVVCVWAGKIIYNFTLHGAVDEAFSLSEGTPQFSSTLQHGVRVAQSNQVAVWASIEEKMARLGTSSPTSAMEDIYQARSGRINDFVAAFNPEPGQTGAVFALNGRVAGIEVFDHPDAFAKMFGKLVRSWALDAIEDSPGDLSAPPIEAAHAFLDIVVAAEMQSFAAVGQGTDVRLSAAHVSGGAIIDGGRVVHLNAFRRAVEGADGTGLGGRPSQQYPAPRDNWIVRASRRLWGR